MNRRWWILMMVVVLALAGCQLAKPEAGEESVIQKDRLIGVYITYESVTKGEIKSSEIKVNAKGEIYIEREKEKERIYAKPIEGLFTRWEETRDFRPEFEGLEGVGRYHLLIPAENGQVETMVVTGDDVFTETYVESKSADNMEQKIKMTMYREERSHEYPIYVNPVYQTADNRIYLQAGPVYQVAGDGMAGNLVLTIKQKESKVTKIEGKQKAENSEVELLVKIENPDKDITIVQMDKENKVLETKSFSAERMPEEFWPNSKAEYLVVLREKENKADVNYHIISRREEELFYFVPAQKGNLRKKTFKINW